MFVFEVTPAACLATSRKKSIWFNS
jgi:hypothetical protein